MNIIKPFKISWVLIIWCVFCNLFLVGMDKLPETLEHHIVDMALACHPLPSLTQWLMTKNAQSRAHCVATLAHDRYKDHNVTLNDVAIISDGTKLICRYVQGVWQNACPMMSALGPIPVREYVPGPSCVVMYDISTNKVLNKKNLNVSTDKKSEISNNDTCLLINGRLPHIWNYKTSDYFNVPVHIKDCCFLKQSTKIIGKDDRNMLISVDISCSQPKIECYFDQPVKCFKVCHERDAIIVQLFNNSVCLLNNSLKVIGNVPGEEFLAVWPHGNFLCTKNLTEGSLCIRSIPDLLLQKTIQLQPDMHIKEVCVSGNGEQLFVTCDQPKQIMVFNVSSGTLSSCFDPSKFNEVVDDDFQLASVNYEGTRAHIVSDQKIVTWYVDKNLTTFYSIKGQKVVPVLFNCDKSLMVQQNGDYLYVMQYQPDIVQHLSNLTIIQLKVLSWIYLAALKCKKFNLSSDSPGVIKARSGYQSLPDALKYIVEPYVNLPGSACSLM